MVWNQGDLDSKHNKFCRWTSRVNSDARIFAWMLACIFQSTTIRAALLIGWRGALFLRPARRCYANRDICKLVREAGLHIALAPWSKGWRHGESWHSETLIAIDWGQGIRYAVLYTIVYPICRHAHLRRLFLYFTGCCQRNSQEDGGVKIMDNGFQCERPPESYETSIGHDRTMWNGGQAIAPRVRLFYQQLDVFHKEFQDISGA